MFSPAQVTVTRTLGAYLTADDVASSADTEAFASAREALIDKDPTARALADIVDAINEARQSSAVRP